jgi:hypothetical protein
MICAECGRCKSPIGVGAQAFEYEGKLTSHKAECSHCFMLLIETGTTYHDECFMCGRCNKPLGFEKFCVNENGFFCENDFDSLYGAYCLGTYTTII